MKNQPEPCVIPYSPNRSSEQACIIYIMRAFFCREESSNRLLRQAMQHQLWMRVFPKPLPQQAAARLPARHQPNSEWASFQPCPARRAGIHSWSMCRSVSCWCWHVRAGLPAGRCLLIWRFVFTWVYMCLYKENTSVLKSFSCTILIVIWSSCNG